MSVIAAEPVFSRRPTLVPLRAEHADEMAAVLAGPGLYIFTRGNPPTPRELPARCQRWIAGTTRQTTRPPGTVSRQLDLGTDPCTGAAAVRASRRLTLSGAVRCPRSAQSKAT